MFKHKLINIAFYNIDIFYNMFYIVLQFYNELNFMYSDPAVLHLPSCLGQHDL